MKGKLFFPLVLILAFAGLEAQVGIGTQAPRGALDINQPVTNTMGLVLPTNDDAGNIVNPAFANESELQELVNLAYEKNWQILAHCNGDAAADEYIRVIEKAAVEFGNDDRRPVAIHSQVVREDQLDKMKELKIMPSFFGMHTYYWGDWHRDVTLGKDRAYYISPAQSALKKGMIFTEHHDAPVALPSSIMILHTAVNRISRSGDVIGPAERISPYDALRSITSWAAYQYFEEDTKGTLTKGKAADFVILDKNPLKIKPEEIKEIKVLKTIKNDKVVFSF